MGTGDFDEDSEFAQAVMKFFETFGKFFDNFEDLEEILHAFVYFDKIAMHCQGKKYFDYYPIFKASKIESGYISKMLGETSLQSYVKKTSEYHNEFMEYILSIVSKQFMDGRKYANELTGDVGK